jgi:hypothetical protein
MTAYVAGQWKAQCDRCGVDYLARNLSKEWTGLRVCRGPGTNDCFEPRHPQDFVKGKADRQSTAWSRPRSPEIDVSVGSGNEVLPDDL